jgi:hypothetical protein
MPTLGVFAAITDAATLARLWTFFSNPLRSFPRDPSIIHLIVPVDAPSMLCNHALGYLGEGLRGKKK